MADQTKKQTIQLRVAQAQQGGMGVGVVRLSRDYFQKLGLKKGDLLEIRGKRSTAAVPAVAYPADRGIDIVRMDGLVRAHASGLRSSPYERILTVD